MTEGKRVAIYCRVSTGSQTVEQQVTACRRYCEAQGWTVAMVVEEVRSTRKTRPAKERLLQALRQREYDVLLVFRLDRWARNLSELVLELEDLTDRGIKVVSINEAIDLTTAMGRAMVQLIGVFAQLERDMRAEATRERLAALKALGKKLGHQSPIRGEKFALLQSLKAQGVSNREAARRLGVSEASIRRALRDGVRRCHPPTKPVTAPTATQTAPLSASPSQLKSPDNANSDSSKRGAYD